MAARPPLALLLAVADPARLRAGLVLALCEAALGGAPRLFVQGLAVALLCPPITGPDDEAARAAGEPVLAELLEEVLAEGIALIACQSGLAMAQKGADALDPRITVGGLIGWLAALAPEDRLVML